MWQDVAIQHQYSESRALTIGKVLHFALSKIIKLIIKFRSYRFIYFELYQITHSVNKSIAETRILIEGHCHTLKQNNNTFKISENWPKKQKQNFFFLFT